MTALTTATPTLLAIDPGSRPGAVELDSATGRVLRATTSLETALQWRVGTPWGIVVTERQWYFGEPPGRAIGKRTAAAGARRRGAVDVNDILTLAFRAGWQFRGVLAVRYMALKPQVWRGSSNAAKLQVQARIAESLTAPERALFRDIPESRQGDVLDAIGIGRAVVALLRSPDGGAAYDWVG